ncbi:MAG TPA: hypothetical protein VHF26_11645 [Trebonia sp.]|nr:hypothetical protein [Trebonia sp.]
MTEAEGRAATDPDPLLEFVRPAASDRKLRLLAAACCRRVWDWMGRGGRRAVEMLERRADGDAAEDDLLQAVAAVAEEWMEEWGTHHPTNAAYCATGYCSAGAAPAPALDAARDAAAVVALAVGAEASVARAVSLGYPPPAQPYSEQDAAACREAAAEAQAAERKVQCRLVRDIFHCPCRPVFLHRSWGHAGDRAVLKLVGTIYRERAFDLLPVLGDALEDAGCEDVQVLAHCRSERLHARGCWLLDALLGKW